MPRYGRRPGRIKIVCHASVWRQVSVARVCRQKAGEVIESGRAAAANWQAVCQVCAERRGRTVPVALCYCSRRCTNA